MAFIKSNGDTHIDEKTRHVNLSEIGNNFQLLPPEIVSGRRLKHAIYKTTLWQMVWFA